MRARLSGVESGPLTGAPKPNCISIPPGSLTIWSYASRAQVAWLPISLLPEPIAEGADFGAFERARRGDDVIGELVRQREREQPDEASGGEVRRGDRAVGQHDTLAGNRRIERQRHAIEGEAGGYRNGL